MDAELSMDILSSHQVDYDSIGGCVCGESYPCTTRMLVTKARNLSAELDRVTAERDRAIRKLVIRRTKDFVNRREGKVTAWEIDDFEKAAHRDVLSEVRVLDSQETT
jgi:hypothetical protein